MASERLVRETAFWEAMAAAGKRICLLDVPLSQPFPAISGIQVLEFNPINPLSARKEWELNQRDHRKLLIVDGRTAFLGGINISGVYSGGSFLRGSRAKPSSRSDASLAWRDTDLQLRGPVVAELQRLFLTTWKNQKGPPLAAKNYFPPPENAGGEVVRAIGSSPDEPYSLIYATLLSAIGSSFATGNFFVNMLVSWVMGIIVGWIGWAILTYFIGSSLFGGRSSVTEMMRVLGFASAPQLLGIFGVIPCLGGIFRAGNGQSPFTNHPV